MHPYLTKLGVRREVQLFFEPFYQCDEAGNLVFYYGDQTEHFGLAWHRVPRAVHWWQAGDEMQARQVLICDSALEAVCFLSVNFHRFPLLHQLLFIALGTAVSADQLLSVRDAFSGRKFALVSGRDLLSRLGDIYRAGVLTGRSLRLYYAGKEQIKVTYRGQLYTFDQAGLTLSLFEKASGFRSGIRTYKPKGSNSFLGQLRASTT